jgi:hypothetical protein
MERGRCTADRLVIPWRNAPTRPRIGMLAVLAITVGSLAGVAVVLDSGHGGAVHATAKASRDRAGRPKGVDGRRTMPPAEVEAERKARVADHPSAALSADAAASFARLLRQLPGPVELTAAPLGSSEAESLGGDAAAAGWSTTKVVVLSALLRARREDLTEQERSWAVSAITESNNESVLALFGDLEQIEGGLVSASAYMQRLLRESGDAETVVATAPPPAGAVTTFGQTQWRPSNAVKFFSALARGCLLSAQGTAFALGLMQHIEPSESWGLGSAGFTSVAFKGGWGPEPDGAYLVRQSGILDIGSSHAVAVAFVAFPPAGLESFTTGTTMATETAKWLRAHLNPTPRVSLGCG